MMKRENKLMDLQKQLREAQQQVRHKNEKEMLKEELKPIDFLLLMDNDDLTP